MTAPGLAGVLASAAEYPMLALAAVALIAFAESLAVVGTFVPAAFAMFCAGVLVGNGTLGMTITLASAAIGAIGGDALSYELGRRPGIRQRILVLAVRRPAVLAKAEGLMRRRGAASVLIARFTGPLRAFVPVLAGLAHMPRARFYGMNIFSACLWAPAHILPGALFGSSLQLAEAVSGRLALLLAVVLALLWVVTWAATALWRLLLPAAAKLWTHALDSLRTMEPRPWVHSALAILDPGGSGARPMVFGTLVLLGAGWLFFGVLEDLVSADPLVQADRSAFNFLQQLRTEAADHVMVLVTQAGSVGVMLPLIVAVLAWLLWRRAWRTAGYWITCVVFAELLVQVLKHTLGRPRPLALYDGGERFSFPSGHATVSAVVLGLLAFLLSRSQPMHRRTAIAAGFSIYVVLVAFSRLYLGAHWLSDVLGGVSIGVAWVALVAMVYTARPPAEDFAPGRLAIVSLVAIVTSAFLWNKWHGPVDSALYANKAAPRLISAATWADAGWRDLPLKRREIAGDAEEPFPLQWACSAQGIAGVLRLSGWHPAAAWTLKSALLAFAQSPPSGELPVLPRFDQGRRPGLTFIDAAAGAPDTRQVLRLWLSEVQLGDARGGGGLPVWYGAVYLERLPPALHRLELSPLDAQPLARALVVHGAALVHTASAANSTPAPTMLSCAGDPARTLPGGNR